MVYLKTIVSAENEIKFIKLNLLESKGFVDKIIVCEFDHTHTGARREFIFDKFLENNTFSEEEKSRIIYIQGKVEKKVKFSTDEPRILHENEKLYRGYFARHMKLKRNDIVFSVDADEIIFSRCYEDLIRLFDDKKGNSIYRLKMYQFYYKPTYLWENVIFTSSIVCRAKHYWLKYPAQWRDEGTLFDKVVGCHFSWQLTVDEMLKKLNTYAHAADYQKLAKREILEDAIKNKKYPFNPQKKFTIKEINYLNNPEYYPDYYWKVKDLFSYLEV